MPDGVILEDELARERRVGVERDRRGIRQRCVGERPDRRRGRPLFCRSRSIAASFVTPAFSAACPAFIALMSSVVTPVTACRRRAVCASWISIGVDAGDVMHDHADWRPSLGTGVATRRP